MPIQIPNFLPHKSLKMIERDILYGVEETTKSGGSSIECVAQILCSTDIFVN